MYEEWVVNTSDGREYRFITLKYDADDDKFIADQFRRIQLLAEMRSASINGVESTPIVTPKNAS